MGHLISDVNYGSEALFPIGLNGVSRYKADSTINPAYTIKRFFAGNEETDHLSAQMQGAVLNRE